MRLGYLYSRYPVLSQTFCDAEMLELERRGFELVVASMYPPKTAVRHEYLERLKAPIRYAPDKPILEKLVHDAKRSGRWPEKLVVEHEKKYGPNYKAALRARNALFFVDLFEREKVAQFHVHFANRAAHTAVFVKAISGIPFSITAHGQDFMIDLGNENLLREICATAEWVAAETEYSRHLLAARCPESADKIFRIYNGIDLRKFPATAKKVSRPGEPLRLLSVGRLVAFKGFDMLIDACAQLRREEHEFTCEIVGDGPLREKLEQRVLQNSLSGTVFFSGEQSQDYVLRSLAACDIFVLASVVDEDGASDVFPTVIAEAMTCGKPVVSTMVAGIPELVSENKTGLLVKPRDPVALSAALARLICDDTLRAEFGRAGRERIEQHFTIETTIEPLLQRFMSGHKPAAARP
ncbi:MAG: glycosyltransferase family 4 protein [Chthoniobacterales bacterium]